MRIPISVDPWAYIFAAGGLLLLPLNWLAAAVTAGLVHELCHILAILLSRGTIHGIRIGRSGAQIDASLPAPVWELPCALAGPIGSFLLLFLSGSFPRVAICGFIHGVFNFLPVYPLDGGRILRCIMALLFPEKFEQAYGPVQQLLLAGGGLVLLFVCARLSLGILPAVLLLSQGFLRNKTCKPGKSGVQ